MKPPYVIAEGAVATEIEGVKLYVIEEGSGAYPTPRSNVTVHYHGMLQDGSVFDSSFLRGESITFPLNNLIPGWVVALPKVPVGSKVKLVIPPQLGYGSRPLPGIPANSVLVFDIELIASS
ncbi:MAG: hypothetical protein EAZ89_02780 [Bacteroidetes bacterium]|nr:MAG: hypothetical protein EAZ89_02780 [Bacteroidota bacterium]